MKRYIILIIVLIVFGFSIYFFIGRDSIAAQKVQTTILLNPDTIFEYSNKKWIKVNSSYLNDYNWKEFDIFLDSKYKGKKLVWHDDQWYIFDKNKNAINYQSEGNNFLAINTNFELNVKKIVTEYDINSPYINKILEINNKSINTQLTTTSLTKIDFDNDGYEEEIYVVSNMFAMDFEPDVIFAYAYMQKNGELIEIYKHEEEGDAYNGCIPSINSILDLEDDKENEIIISCEKFSAQEPINMIYKFDNTQFNKLISNE